MKYSLFAAVAVLALAQGIFAEEAFTLDNLGQYFEEMKNKMTQELTEILRNQDLANQAQTFIQDKRAQLEPVAAQLQEQLRTAATKVEEQMRPLATDVQAQVQPMLQDFQRQMEAIFQKMTEQARAIGN